MESGGSWLGYPSPQVQMSLPGQVAFLGIPGCEPHALWISSNSLLSVFYRLVYQAARDRIPGFACHKLEMLSKFLLYLSFGVFSSRMGTMSSGL